MLRHIKHRHSNIKGMRYQENGNKGFEKPFKEHECFYVVHIVFFRYHADKLITEDIGNDKPRNGYNHIFGQILYHVKNVCIPPLRGLAYLRCNGAYFFVYVPEHSGKVAVNGSDKDFLYPFVNRFQYALHRLPSVNLSEQTGKKRYKDSADKGNTAARHKLLNAL
ncbi:hypothetical protein QIY_1011 [Clostridioides difficile DA00141]|nr:hypothetical protein QIY_1011 [Clostridioides difficile DA00141]